MQIGCEGRNNGDGFIITILIKESARTSCICGVVVCLVKKNKKFQDFAQINEFTRKDAFHCHGTRTCCENDLRNTPDHCLLKSRVCFS